MIVSIVIAQTTGFFLFIFGILMLTCAKRFKVILKEIAYNDIAVFLSSWSSLLLGCFLLVLHNILTDFPQLIISILGYILVIKAILWLTFPEKMRKMVDKVLDGSSYIMISLLHMAAGIFFLSCGFGVIWG